MAVLARMRAWRNGSGAEEVVRGAWDVGVCWARSYGVGLMRCGSPRYGCVLFFSCSPPRRWLLRVAAPAPASVASCRRRLPRQGIEKGRRHPTRRGHAWPHRGTYIMVGAAAAALSLCAVVAMSRCSPRLPPPPRLHCGGSALLPPLLPPPRPNAAPDTPRAHLLACTPQPHQPCGASPAPPPTQHIHTTQPAGVRPPAPPFPRERRPRRQPHQQPAGSPAWPPAGGGGGGGTDATGRALLATRGGGVVAGADLGPVDHIPDGRQVGHLVVLVLQVKRVLSGEKRAGSQGTDGREAGRKQQRDRRRTAGWRKTREGTGGCPRGQSASQPRWRPQPAATAVGCHRAAPTR